MQITRKLYIKYTFLVKMNKIYIFNLLHYPIGIHQSLYCKKVSSYIAQYPVLRTAQSTFTLYFPDRPVQSNTISTALGSIPPYATINARRLLIHISTTVYSQVLIYTAECTKAM